MTLQEAINHIDDKIKDMKCEQCKVEHIQLKEWLIELQEFRKQKEIILC
nr:MAG TPA: hypothetical protein [Caudoviricetes sp.]